MNREAKNNMVKSVAADLADRSGFRTGPYRNQFEGYIRIELHKMIDRVISAEHLENTSAP